MPAPFRFTAPRVWRIALLAVFALLLVLAAPAGTASGEPAIPRGGTPVLTDCSVSVSVVPRMRSSRRPDYLSRERFFQACGGSIERCPRLPVG